MRLREFNPEVEASGVGVDREHCNRNERGENHHGMGLEEELKGLKTSVTLILLTEK